MILKAKGDYGVMPKQNSAEYGISPVDGKENEKVWPKYERGNFLIVKGEDYNVSKSHPFFEGGDKVFSSKKVQDDAAPSPDKRKRASG